MKKTNICGVGFSDLSEVECAEVFRDQAAKSAGNRFIVTPNVDFIVRVDKDAGFRTIVNQADISVCDSTIVLWASILLGRKLKAKITGSDASRLLFSIARERHEGVFFLGSDGATLGAMAERLVLAYPGLVIAGVHDGYFDPAQSPDIIRKINDSGAKYLFVGMGSPKQEKWVQQYRGQLNVRLIICVGGLFDVLSGKIKRAPRLMQVCGLEWFWRLVHDPVRLGKRYFIEDASFFAILVKSFFKP